MDWKRHTFLITSVSVLSVVACGVLYLLLQNRSAFNESKQKLEAAEGQLDRLRAGQPYPSPENVNVVDQNRKALAEFAGELRGKLRSGQVHPLEVEPAQFPLEATFTRLNRLARANGVTVEANSVYGFDLYVGAIPKREHVQRLTIQLQAVEKLCGVLLTCQIDQLLNVTREVFEEVKPAVEISPVPTRRGRRGRGREQPEEVKEVGVKPGEVSASSLYEVEKFTLSFATQPDAAWCLLNRLATLDMFTLVKSINLKGLSPADLEKAVFAKKPKGEDSLELGQPTITLQEMTSHEERLVAGRDRVEVTLDLEMYRFVGEDGEADAADTTEKSGGGD